jgi:hypothetical protein
MDRPTTQKMIICHDMMGGYVKDKFTQGIRWLFELRVASIDPSMHEMWVW